MFNVFILLPKLFRTAQLLSELLSGGVTKEKMEEIVDELYEMLLALPELQAFAGIIAVVVRIAKVIIPAIPVNKEVRHLLSDAGVTPEEIAAAQSVLEMWDELEVRLLADSTKVRQKIEAMSDKDVLGNV